MTHWSEHRLPLKTVSITIVVGLLVYWAAVLLWTDWASVRGLVGCLSWVVRLQVGALAFLNYSMRFLRWNRFMRDLGHR